MAKKEMALNLPKITDDVCEFIENKTELPDTYLEAIDRSINNLLVEYFTIKPETTEQKFNEDGSPKPIKNISEFIILKIRENKMWMDKLSKSYTERYKHLKGVSNIPTKGEYFAEKNSAEKKSSYKRYLKPAKIDELRNALSVILYNTEIKDVAHNVTRIIYGIQRLQLGHPNPNIGTTALFFYSICQGNGKSTAVNSLLDAGKFVGLNAMNADIEKITNSRYADTKHPLDNFQLMCQPSFLRESKDGIDRKRLENMIDGEPLYFDVKFKEPVCQRFEGLICVGGNCIPKIGDRRYSVIRLVEEKLSKFDNKPSKQDIEKAWIYLLTHVVDDNIFKILVPWEELNTQKGVQNATTKAELYDALCNMCPVLSDTDEVRIQVQSILAKFRNVITPDLRKAYREEIKSLVAQGIIKCDTEEVTNQSYLRFSREDTGKLNYGDEPSKHYDFKNHTKLIRQAIEEYLPDSLEEQQVVDPNLYIYKPGEFIEWGLYGYDQNGDYQVLNNLKSPEVPEGYVSPRVQSNCFLNRFLYESDDMPLAEQKAVLEKLIQKKAVYRAVYSGSKSIHIIVEIDCECSDIKEYKFFWKEIAKELGLKIDSVDNRCSENSRLTRRPDKMRVLEKEKFEKYSKDAVELFGAKVEPELYKIEQKLLYAGYNVYNCYFRIKSKYLEEKISKEVIVSKKLVYFDREHSDIGTFIINYANKNAIDLDFSEGNGHNLGCTLIGACKTAGFESDEIENWLHDNCYRFDELRPQWKGLL